MNPIRMHNWTFFCLRAFAVLMFLLMLIFACYLVGHPSNPKDRAGGIQMAIVASVLALVNIIGLLRCVIWVELGDEVSVRRLLSLRRYPWKQVSRLTLTRNVGLLNLVPVAKFISITFHFRSNNNYIDWPVVIGSDDFYIHAPPSVIEEIAQAAAAHERRDLLNNK
jgi:hypothetical protein